MLYTLPPSRFGEFKQVPTKDGSRKVDAQWHSSISQCWNIQLLEYTGQWLYGYYCDFCLAIALRSWCTVPQVSYSTLTTVDCRLGTTTFDLLGATSPIQTLKPLVFSQRPAQRKSQNS